MEVGEVGLERLSAESEEFSMSGAMQSHIVKRAFDICQTCHRLEMGYVLAPTPGSLEFICDNCYRLKEAPMRDDLRLPRTSIGPEISNDILDVIQWM